MKTLKCINREKRMEARAQAEVVRVRNGWGMGSEMLSGLFRNLVLSDCLPITHPTHIALPTEQTLPTNIEASPAELCSSLFERQTKKFK